MRLYNLTRLLKWATLTMLIGFSLIHTSVANASYHIGQVIVDPFNPGTTDSVTMTASGSLSTPCHELVIPPVVNVTGNTITMDLNYQSVGEICVQVLGSFSDTVTLGQLPAGTYNYTVRLFINSSLVDSFFGNFNVRNVIASPLPDDTLLLLEPGTVLDTMEPCLTGSCFGMGLSQGLWIWTSILPGLDGGFVVGKDQSCGGQDMGSSETNITPGELTDAWFFFGVYGTFCANNSLNTFSNTSNDGTTAINDLTMAWNGTVISLGGGSVNDYIIDLDGMGGGHWRMDYTSVVPSGPFTGVTFRLITEGGVVPVDTINNPPVVNDISFPPSLSGATTNWSPDFTDDPGDTHTCAITSNGLYGNATVNADCSGGTYTSGLGYYGSDSFEYTVTDQEGLSSNGIVTAEIVACIGISCQDPCQNDYPLKQIVTVGGGQSQTVNASMQTVFTGHIMTEAGLTTGGKSAVKICPNSVVDFETTSTVGTASCSINGAPGASRGTLTLGDKLICTNKPDGGDVDRFSIKSGL